MRLGHPHAGERNVFKHILVTTDLSANSEAAFDWVREFAVSPGARITILFVNDSLAQIPRAVLAFPRHTAEQLKQNVEASVAPRLQALRDSKLPSLPDTRLVMVENVNPAEAICDFARANGCDLIAISTHGRSGVARLLMGSIAERVVRGASCPVLTVHPTSTASPS